MVLSVKWESSDSPTARSAMPSSLESLAESSLNEKEQKTKTRGKCVCRGASAQGKAFRQPAQVHTVTAPEAHLPHYRAPLLPTMYQGVLCSGHTQKPNPEPASRPTLQGSQQSRAMCILSVYMTPSQAPSHATLHPLTCLPLSPCWGQEAGTLWGQAAFRHIPSPTSGQILNLPVRGQSSSSVKWG